MDSDSETMIRYSVVYVNYNALGFIRDSIASLRAYHADEIVEYVIVSNSVMESSELDAWIDRPTHLKIIQLEENHGFAYANNAGVKQASGEFVFILNPDTLVTSPVLPGLEAAWTRLDNPGVIGPLTRYADGTIQPTIKVRYSPIKLLSYIVPYPLPFIGKRHYSEVTFPDESTSVDVVGGSALFLSKARYEDMNGMDERLFLYWEEDDLCLRLWKSDYQVWFERDVEIIHLESRIAKRENLDLQEIRYVSKYHFMEVHYPDEALKDATWSVVVFFLRFVLSIPTGSSFKIRFNARLLRWHWEYVMKRM